MDNTPTAAEGKSIMLLASAVSDDAVDVWVFLELFLNRFREYSELPFHVAAERYCSILRVSSLWTEVT